MEMLILPAMSDPPAAKVGKFAPITTDTRRNIPMKNLVRRTALRAAQSATGGPESPEGRSGPYNPLSALQGGSRGRVGHMLSPASAVGADPSAGKPLDRPALPPDL